MYSPSKENYQSTWIGSGYSLVYLDRNSENLVNVIRFIFEKYSLQEIDI